MADAQFASTCLMTALHENTDSDQNTLSTDTFSCDKCNIIQYTTIHKYSDRFQNGWHYSEEEATKTWTPVSNGDQFSDEDQKKGFSSRLDNARHSLSAGSSRAVDNYKLLSTLLDHFDQDCVDVNDEAPSTSSRKKPLLKHSGIIVI